MNGEILVYEPFDGPFVNANIQGLNGGEGFSSAWQFGGFNVSQSLNYLYKGESLNYYTLPVEAGRLSSTAQEVISGVERLLGTSLGQTGSTFYMSFLLRPEGTINQGAFNGFFGVYLNTGTELYMGKPGGGFINNYVIEDRGGSLQWTSPVGLELNETAFLVLKAQFLDGADTFTLYVNPPPVAVEPASGIVKNDHFSTLIGGLTVYSTGAFSLDEIRIGETYADVAPFIPPQLDWSLDGDSIIFNWDAPGFQLESKSSLDFSLPWEPISPGQPVPIQESIPATGAGAKFYRLNQAP